MSATKNYLVTGANSGLGLDASRQLSLLPDTKMVYMACRTESKALKAIDDIVRKANAPNDKLKFIKFDSSSTKRDIQHVIDDLAEGEKLDGLILNAGGMVSCSNVVPTSSITDFKHANDVSTYCSSPGTRHFRKGGSTKQRCGHVPNQPHWSHSSH